jgi:hypothetical protein
MAISFVSQTSTANSSTGTSLVINAPATISVGNLLVACIWVGDGQITSAPTGWFPFYSSITGTGHDAMAVWCKNATGSEPSNYTFTSSSSAYLVGAILNYQGAAYVSALAFQGSAGTTLTYSSVSPTADGEVWITIGGSYNAQTPTTPSGFTSRATANGGGSSGAIGVFEQALTSRSATGTTTSTISSSGDWGTISLLLTPGAALNGIAVKASTSNHGSGAGSLTISAPTAAAGDMIVVMVGAESTTTSAPTVSSVSGGSLSWTQRSTNTANGSQQSGSQRNVVEYWYAYATSSSGFTITVNFNHNFDDCSMAAISVTSPGTVIWDTVDSLPAVQTNTTGTANTITKSITLTSTQALVLEFVAAGNSSTPTAGTGNYVQIAYIPNGGGTNWCNALALYSPEVAGTVTLAPCVNNESDYVYVVDALVPQHPVYIGNASPMFAQAPVPTVTGGAGPTTVNPPPAIIISKAPGASVSGGQFITSVATREVAQAVGATVSAGATVTATAAGIRGAGVPASLSAGASFTAVANGGRAAASPATVTTGVVVHAMAGSGMGRAPTPTMTAPANVTAVSAKVRVVGSSTSSGMGGGGHQPEECGFIPVK